MAINQKKYNNSPKKPITLQNSITKLLKRIANEKYLRWTPCTESGG